MTSYSSYTPSKPDKPEPKPCAACDLSDFDKAKCEIEGVAAEAEYLKKYQDKLTERRTQFDTARTEYDRARQEVADDLALITQQLKRIREQLVCQLNEHKRKCLTDGWEEVQKDLAACPGYEGCCVTQEQCTFDWTLSDEPTPAEIRGLIEDFDRRVTAAEKCFDDVLVKEPAELKKRVADLKTYVEAIKTSAADPKTNDYSEPFARLLWAEYRRKAIWLGFDNANDYFDCLCTALNCSLHGRRALAALTGVYASLDCQERGARERCAWLRMHVVEEILAACRRACPPKGNEEPTQSAM